MGDDARGQRGGARHGRAERDGISRRPAARAATIAIVVALLAGSLAAAAMPAWAGTLTFTPDADSKVQQANPATNYGASTTLKVDGSMAVGMHAYWTESSGVIFPLWSPPFPTPAW